MRLEYDSPRVGDVKRNYSDTSKSERILNWKSEVKVSNGIKRTLDWFLSNI
jgi:UDP-glucose 4-epimerase